MGKVIDISENRKYKVSTVCAVLEKIHGYSAAQILEQYRRDTTLPISVAKILENIGISTISNDFRFVDKAIALGAAVSRGDNLAIFYNPAFTYNQQVLTLAIELGICCYKPDSIKTISHVLYNNRKFNSIEQKAYYFALELLIPKNDLMRCYNKFLIPSITALCEIFRVSPETMIDRLEQLGLSYYKDLATERTPFYE